MYKSILALTFLLFTNISISALDINETSEIIKEATEATQAIKDDFSTLINEQEKVITITDINKSIDSNISMKNDGSLPVFIEICQR